MTTSRRYEGLSLLGKSGAEAQHNLEVFPAPIGIGLVTFVAPEFTSVCPVTKQPDFGVVKIEYLPNKECLESKSLKLYLQTFRNRGIFYEELAVTIRTALVETLLPQWIRVTVFQQPRGGISLECQSEWGTPPGTEIVVPSSDDEGIPSVSTLFPDDIPF